VSDAEALLVELRTFEGQSEGAPHRGPDEVNQAMIRHWVEAMGDENPVYVDGDAARANGFPGVIAPPTMLQAWVMRGYKATAEAERLRVENAVDDSPQDRLRALFDGAGFTSVVATNCDQEYVRPLVLGDHLSVSSIIESISEEKHTGLGEGHFVTTRLDFTDQHGAPVATMRFRILRFRPGTGKVSSAAPAGPTALRPHPALTQDNAFFFEGTQAGKLLIQRCASCATLRHPPRPACAVCGSFEWDTVESSRRATVFSFVVVHHPQVPSFDYPLPIATVELEEGTRLVVDVIGASGDELAIGMPGTVELVAVDDELTLPMFRPGEK
jgi:uncharacterized protein